MLHQSVITILVFRHEWCKPKRAASGRGERAGWVRLGTRQLGDEHHVDPLRQGGASRDILSSWLCTLIVRAHSVPRAYLFSFRVR